MADDVVGLGFDSQPLERGVDAGIQSLDKLVAQLGKLERAVAKYKRSEAEELEGALKLVAKHNTSLVSLFNEARDNALKVVQSGNLEQLKLVKSQNSALQSLYEARLALAGKLSSEELATWKAAGANIGKVQAAQLKDFKANAAEQLAIAEASNKAIHAENLRAMRQSLQAQKDFASQGSKLYSQLNIKSSGTYSYIKDTEAAGAALRNFYATYERVYNKLGAMSKIEGPLSSIRESIEVDSKAALAAMNKFYTDQERVLRNIQNTRSGGRVSTAQRMSKEDVYQGAMSEMRNFYLDQGGVSSYGGSSWAAPVKAASAAVNTELDKTTESVNRLRGGMTASRGLLRAFGDDMGYAHSMARGLSSGFGLLWLTWGKIAPLLAGASLSFGIKKTFDIGSEVESAIKFLTTVGELSKETGAAIRQELREINKETLFTLNEVTEGMVNIVKAGQSVPDAMKIIRPATALATATRSTMDDASKAIIQTMGIFSKSADEAGSIASKLAYAERASTVELKDLIQSLKMTAESGVKFGQSFESTLAVITSLGEVQIKAGLSGTAFRNMLIDLYGRTKASRKLLDDLNKSTGSTVSAFDELGRQRDVIDIFEDLDAAIKKLKPEEAQKFIQGFFSERGYRGAVTLFRDGADAVRKFREEFEKIDDNQAVQMQASMMDTVKGVTAMVRSNMSNTLDTVFEMHQEQFKNLLQSVVTFVSSPAFVEALNTIVKSFLNLAAAVRNNIDWIILATKAFVSLKLAAIALNVISAVGTWLAALTAKTILAKTATDGHTASIVRNTIAMRGQGAALIGGAVAAQAAAAGTSAAATATAAAAAATAGAAVKATGAAVALRGVAAVVGFLMGPVGALVTMLGVLGGAWYAMSSKAGQASDDLTSKVNANGRLNIEILDKEISKLKERALLLNVEPDELAGIKALKAQKRAEYERAKALREAEKARFNDPNAPVTSRNLGENSRLAREEIRLRSELIEISKREALTRIDLEEAKEAQKQAALRKQQEQANRASVVAGNVDLTPTGGGGSPAEMTNTYTAAVRENIAALKQQADAAAAAGKASYDAQIRIINARQQAGLLGEGALEAETLAATVAYERERVQILKNSNQTVRAEYERVAAEEIDRYDRQLANSKLKGSEKAKFELELHTNLTERLSSLNERYKATVEQNETEITKTVEEAHMRRTLAAIAADGELKKLQDSQKSYWENVDKTSQQTAEVYALSQAFRSVTDDSDMFSRAQKAAAEAALSTSHAHSRELASWEESVRKATEAYANISAKVAELRQYGPVHPEFEDLLKNAERRVLESEEGLARTRIKINEDVANKAGLAYTKSMQESINKIADGISDAIMTALEEGGEAGKKKLRDLIVAELKKPIRLVINAVVNFGMSMVTSALSALFGMGGGGAGGIGSMLSMAGTALKFMGGGTGGAATSAMTSMAAQAGQYGAGLALNAVGATNMAYAAAVPGLTSSAAGSQAAMLASQTQGFGAYGVTATAAAGGNAAAGGAMAASNSGWLAATGWGALIAAAIAIANNLYDKGYDRAALGVGENKTHSFMNTSFTTNNKLGQSDFYKYSHQNINRQLGDMLGLSEKWTDILSGTVGMAAMFGRKLASYGYNVHMSGQSMAVEANAHYKGGLFRSDKVEKIDVNAQDAEMLKKGIMGVKENVKGMAVALGGSAAAVDNYTGMLRVNMKGAHTAEQQAQRLSEAYSELSFQMLRAATGGQLTKERFAEIMEQVSKSIEAAGISVQSMGQTMAAAMTGQMSGAEAGEALVTQVLGGIYNSLATPFAQQIGTAIQSQILTPIFTAITMQAPIAGVVSQAAIQGVMATAQTAINNISAIFADPGFRSLMSQLDGVLRQIGGMSAQPAANVVRFGNAVRSTSTAARDARAEWQKLADSIGEEIKRIRGLLYGNSPAAQENAQAAFNAALHTVRTGNREQAQAAAERLPELSQNLLEFASNNAVSLSELQRIQAATMGSLVEIRQFLRQRYRINIPAFASGGDHSGGWALVGEHGPELAHMPRSRVYNNNDTSRIFDNSAVELLLAELVEQIEGLRAEVVANVKQTAKATKAIENVTEDNQHLLVRIAT